MLALSMAGDGGESTAGTRRRGADSVSMVRRSPTSPSGNNRLNRCDYSPPLFCVRVSLFLCLCAYTTLSCSLRLSIPVTSLVLVCVPWCVCVSVCRCQWLAMSLCLSRCLHYLPCSSILSFLPLFPSQRRIFCHPSRIILLSVSPSPRLQGVLDGCP